MDETQQPQPKKNGGARPGAGRKPGGHNAKPTHAMRYEAQMHDLIGDRFRATFEELVRLALHADRDADRLKAIEMLHNRILGKPREFINVTNETPPSELPEWTDE